MKYRNNKHFTCKQVETFWMKKVYLHGLRLIVHRLSIIAIVCYRRENISQQPNNGSVFAFINSCLFVDWLQSTHRSVYVRDKRNVFVYRIIFYAKWTSQGCISIRKSWICSHWWIIANGHPNRVQLCYRNFIIHCHSSFSRSRKQEFYEHNQQQTPPTMCSSPCTVAQWKSALPF